jgi:hypothetical protein
VQASAATVETVKAPAITVTPTVVPATIGSTATLIRLLDVAGCDFAALQITENQARKGSGTLAIACK